MDETEARQITVTAKTARREVENHEQVWAEFQDYAGDHAEYSGAVVLDFLGY